MRALHSWLVRDAWRAALPGLLAAILGAGELGAQPAEPQLSATALFEAIGDPHKTTGLATGDLDAFEASLSRGSASWPLERFLAAEARRRRGEIDPAREGFRAVATWSVQDPYGDGWGGSAISVLALHRWLEIVRAQPQPDATEVEELLEVGPTLLHTRLARGLFADPILESLPQLEEQIARGMASLAWEVGDQKTSLPLFFEYLTVTSTWDPQPHEEQMMNRLVEQGLVTNERFELFLGKRLHALNRPDEAVGRLRMALLSDALDVRAEAALILLDLTTKQEALDLVNQLIEESFDADVVAEALYRRGLLDETHFHEDMERIVQELPNNRRANFALNRLATRSVAAGDLDAALAYWERLRRHEGEADNYRNSAYYKPALALYQRGEPGDTERAIRILEELQAERPRDQLHSHSLFWLGRMNEEIGAADDAKRHFEQVIADEPYGYYATRARMHRNAGVEARKSIRPDPGTRSALAAAARQSAAALSAQPFPGTVSPYHARLERAFDGELYRSATRAVERLRRAFPKDRLEDVPLSQLDQQGLLDPIGVLLALRQDALAAADVCGAPAACLATASAVGHRGGDWAMNLKLVVGEPLFDSRRAALQQDRAYLAAAYPSPPAKRLAAAAERWGAQPDLLYAVVREESLFSPTALSSAGALGYFQFTPRTFDGRAAAWGLLEENVCGATTREAFLLDPACSADLGARWFGTLLVPNQDGDELFAVLEHFSGAPMVDRWKARERAPRFRGDVEFLVEFFGGPYARNFARSVLTDVAIVEASGIFGPAPQGATEGSSPWVLAR
jgi:tetratricopeptide (TPR) repeat protein